MNGIGPDLRVWRFVDGKPGHEHQSLGLLRALQARTRVTAFDIPVRKGWRNLRDLLLRRCVPGAPEGRPDLLLGAGHATHLPMLACQQARGGRTVVLMRPSLPMRCFDRCVIPEHDGVPASSRVFVSRGALNTMHPGAKDPAAPALVLLGGPSREYDWDSAALIEQLAIVVAADAPAWRIIGSRRTPAATLQAVRATADLRQAEVLAVDEVPAGWLATQLPRTERAWVTEDSASMVYEVLSAGAACGILSVPLKHRGRVRRGIESLMGQRLVTGMSAYQQGQPLLPPAQPFDEAGRCAQWLLE